MVNYSEESETEFAVNPNTSAYEHMFTDAPGRKQMHKFPSSTGRNVKCLTLVCLDGDGAAAAGGAGGGGGSTGRPGAGEEGQGAGAEDRPERV